MNNVLLFKIIYMKWCLQTIILYISESETKFNNKNHVNNMTYLYLLGINDKNGLRDCKTKTCPLLFCVCPLDGVFCHHILPVLLRVLHCVPDPSL